MIQTGKAKMIAYSRNFNPLLYQGADNLRDDDSPQKVHLLIPSDFRVSFNVSYSILI
jgi:hypothetical protein